MFKVIEPGHTMVSDAAASGSALESYAQDFAPSCFHGASTRGSNGKAAREGGF